MKRLYRTIIFTLLITFICMSYIYLRADPFRQRKIEFNISNAQDIRYELEEIEKCLDEREGAYDKLLEIGVQLSE